MQICQETIIILHGWQSSKEKWQKVKQEIEQYYENTSRNIKIIVPDLPGFKKETKLDRIWNLDDYVEWFKNFSSEVSEPFFLLGHSFGGRIAIKFAQKYPEKLKGLILVSSAGIKPKKRLYLYLISAVAKFGRRFSFLPFYSFSREFFYKYILRKTDYIKAEKLSYLKETFKKVIEEDLFPYLSQIKIPCLIIWGEKDKMTPISDAYLMNKKIPNSQLEVLKNIGHFPHIDVPKILTQKIQNFIESFTEGGRP